MNEVTIHPMVADVAAFFSVLEHPCADQPKLDMARMALRMSLIREEMAELEAAVLAQDIVEVADACCDLIYVVIGKMLTHGIPIDACWDEVQRSNMAKVWPDGTIHKREDGKGLKPPGWTPPDLRGAFRQAYEKKFGAQQAHHVFGPVVGPADPLKEGGV